MDFKKITKTMKVLLVISSIVFLWACSSYRDIFKSDLSGSGNNTTSTTTAIPSFDPAAGSYSTAQSVTITSTTSGATLLYTTDGSTPTHTSGTPTGTTVVYSTTVNVATTSTLKAIAYQSGMTDSAVATAAYTITPDVTAPTLLSSTPTDTATGIVPCNGTPCTGKIILVFSESMNTELGQTLTTEIYNGTAYVTAPNTGTIFTWSTTTSSNDTLTINFSGSWYWFAENSQIRYTLDATGIKDVANNQIAANVQRSFTTTTANQGFAVADTGQTSCYDNSALLGACNNASWPRQDADNVNIPNARSFTGPTPDATFTSDYTTTDNITTLVWKSCTEGLSGAACATGTASTMTWYNALNQCSVLNSMNASAGYASRTKWRLPTFAELKTLPNYNVISPAIDGASFPATVAASYWSSSTRVGSTFVQVRTVYFGNGTSGYDVKTNNYSVRCVTTGP